ncbi:MAG: NUDIX hydrolase [Patescibacteria group bacterium]|nr:NUDIX hydrolase [Patescibacteria group bacterium]
MNKQKTKNIIKTNEKKVALTWIKTDNPNQFKPCCQIYGIVFDQTGKILLIQEKGKWKIPGGTPEGAETPTETLKRELLEEADIKVKKVMPLGVQRIDHPNNPDKKQGNLFFQYRFVCLVDQLLNQTPDPATGLINPRKFVPAEKVTEYVKWGKTGNAMFQDAIKLFKKINKINFRI